MDAQIRRRRILDAIKRLLLRESLNQPLILVFEDLHWLDAETQTFLTLLSESIPTARILLLVNYRPEYRHDWSNKGYYTQLRLDPLGREQAEEMLTVLLGDVEAQHAAPLRQFILDKTEGNPFFMEEIVQELREQGILTDPRRVGIAHQYVDLRLPTTVQGILAARMDRLPPDEKGLLQTLAVIGREFSASLLKRVVTQPETELYRQLADLQAAEFIYEQPAFPDVEYIFKHALTQEVAYNSLLHRATQGPARTHCASNRRSLSRSLDDHYSELAHHYSRSGNTQKAVDYLQLGGATSRTAVGQCRSDQSPHDSPRVAQDAARHTRARPAGADLQITLGRALFATSGWASPDTERTYTRARELCEQMGETRQLFPVLYGLVGLTSVRGRIPDGARAGGAALHPGPASTRPGLFLVAHFALGNILYYLGELLKPENTWSRV